MTAQTLLRQAKRFAGSVRVTELTRELGPVHLRPTDPPTVLRQHVAGKRLWWRQNRPGSGNEWVSTATCWVGSDERSWVEVTPLILVIVAEVTDSLFCVVQPSS